MSNALREAFLCNATQNELVHMWRAFTVFGDIRLGFAIHPGGVFAMLERCYLQWRTGSGEPAF